MSSLENLIIVRGGGDLATGTIYKLYQCGFPVLVLETKNPSAIRRNVAFSEAVYQGMQTVEGLSGGRLRLAAGTLYGAINTMLDRGWITALPGESDSRKKEYRITEAGLTVLRGELERLEELTDNGKRLLEERDNEGNLL